MNFKMSLLTAFFTMGLGVSALALEVNQTQNDKNESKHWEDRLKRVIDLRQKLLNEYNECLAKAEGNGTLENICAQALQDGGKELNDMRDETGIYTPTTIEKDNVYNPSEEDKKKDKKLSECFEKTDGNPECYYKFEDLNVTSYEEYVDNIAKVEKK